MRTHLFLLGIFGAGVVAPQTLTAQQPARDALQRQIVERLIENFRIQSGLNDEQSARFRVTFQRHFRERRELEARQRDLVQSLESQLRPGVAANVDSLNVLLGTLAEHRQAAVDLENRFETEYASFLSPVQHAQLVLTLVRFQRQIDNVLRRRVNQNRL